MYAIVRTGGKQYRVEEGRAVTVERLPAGEGETVELQDVLLIADDGNVTVGTPVIEGARVVAQVEANGRGPKIIVFKYKAKVRTRKKTGHRQSFTRLVVQEILLPGQESKAAKPKRARRRAAEAEEEASAEAIAETPAAEAPGPVVEEAPAPKRRTRRAGAPAAKAAPKRPARRAAAKPKPGAAKASKTKAAEKPKTPRRRSTRKTE